MIDIHTHILPDVDDGPFTMTESLKMLLLAERDGVSHIAATPHLFGEMDSEQCALIMSTYEELKLKAAETGLTLSIHLACESFITPNFTSLLQQPCGTFDGKGKCVLIEFAMTDLPFGYESVLFDMVNAGVKPIIAHPERNMKVIMNLKHAQNMIDFGAYLQVNSGSLLGNFGRKVRKTAIRMLEQDMIFVVASDAHDSQNRPPNLGKARQLLEKIAGYETARRLLWENPRYILFPDGC